MKRKEFWKFWETKGRFFAFGLGLGLVVLGFSLVLLKETSSLEPEFFQTPEKSEEKAEIVVNVSGAVISPGVYQLDKGARLALALEKAGGLAEKADKDWLDRNLNLARILNDGEKIFIPEKGEAVSSDKGAVSSQEGKVAGAISDLVNINTASEKELDTLPGIGPAFAQRIIDYREKQGGFKTIEEIQAVAGIGPKLFEKIREKITL
jgi:competence protein ComEA